MTEALLVRSSTYGSDSSQFYLSTQFVEPPPQRQEKRVSLVRDCGDYRSASARRPSTYFPTSQMLVGPPP